MANKIIPLILFMGLNVFSSIIAQQSRCADTLSVEININGDTTRVGRRFCQDSLLKISILDTISFTDFSWASSDGQTSPLAVWEVTFSQLRQYNVNVRALDANGCVYLGFKNIEVVPCASPTGCKLVFPNIFTPDQDGRNDTFGAIFDCKPTYFELKIFNRWGQLVFETQDFLKTWDGQLQGKDAPSDVYVWYARYRLPEETTERTSKGSLTLLK